MSNKKSEGENSVSARGGCAGVILTFTLIGALIGVLGWAWYGWDPQYAAGVGAATGLAGVGLAISFLPGIACCIFAVVGFLAVAVRLLDRLT